MEGVSGHGSAHNCIGGTLRRSGSHQARRPPPIHRHPLGVCPPSNAICSAPFLPGTMPCTAVPMNITRCQLAKQLWRLCNCSNRHAGLSLRYSPYSSYYQHASRILVCCLGFSHQMPTFECSSLGTLPPSLLNQPSALPCPQATLRSAATETKTCEASQPVCCCHQPSTGPRQSPSIHTAATSTCNSVENAYIVASV